MYVFSCKYWMMRYYRLRKSSIKYVSSEVKGSKWDSHRKEILNNAVKWKNGRHRTREEGGRKLELGETPFMNDPWTEWRNGRELNAVTELFLVRLHKQHLFLHIWDDNEWKFHSLGINILVKVIHHKYYKFLKIVFVLQFGRIKMDLFLAD